MVTHARNPFLEFAATGADALLSLARARISLTPGEIAEIDSTTNRPRNLRFGVEAQSLASVDTAKVVSASSAE